MVVCHLIVLFPFTQIIFSPVHYSKFLNKDCVGLSVIICAQVLYANVYA